MKKLLLSVMLSALVLAGCNSKTEEETTDGSDSITVENEKEALTDKSVIQKSIEKYGEVVSYIQDTTLDIKDDEDTSSIKIIMTIDKNRNGKFEADVDDEVMTFYEVDDEAFTVQDGKLLETDALNLASNATYGDIIKVTEDLEGGKIKQEEDKFYLTYDLSNEENREALFGSNLAQSIEDLENVKGTLVLTYSKGYLLTEAKVEGTAQENGETIDFKGTSKFINVDSVDEIELPE